MSQPSTTTIVPQTELEREIAIAERLEEEERAGMAARWEEETSRAREAAAATKAASLEAERKKEEAAERKRKKKAAVSEEKQKERFERIFKGKGAKGGEWARQQTKVSIRDIHCFRDPY
jgi:hypothetical protein